MLSFILIQNQKDLYTIQTKSLYCCYRVQYLVWTAIQKFLRLDIPHLGIITLKLAQGLAEFHAQALTKACSRFQIVYLHFWIGKDFDSNQCSDNRHG